MDRLLRMAFEKLIRAGNLRVSTAGGSTFTLGDGTGRPVANRFITHAAERCIFPRPSDNPECETRRKALPRRPVAAQSSPVRRIGGQRDCREEQRVGRPAARSARHLEVLRRLTLATMEQRPPRRHHDLLNDRLSLDTP